jgi:hypothetical protein
VNDLARLYFWIFVKTTHNDNICASAYDSIQVRMSAMPVPEFTADQNTGSAPLTVQFTDQSTINPGKIISWEWTFGDGSMSGDTNPVHTYTSLAKYDVKLKVTSDALCEKEITKPEYITLGIKPISHNTGFLIYPNPAHNILNIENPLSESANLLMSDIFGRTLLEQRIIPGKSTINIKTLKPGLFFLFLDGKTAGKVVIE